MKKTSTIISFVILIIILTGCSNVRTKQEKSTIDNINKNLVANASKKTNNIKSNIPKKHQKLVIRWVKKNSFCNNFLEQVDNFNEGDKVANCFKSAILELSQNRAPRYLLDYLYQKIKPLNLSKNILGEILKHIAYGRSRETLIIKQLIKAGAPTQHINVASVRDGNATYCKSNLAILKNNQKQYKKGILIIGDSPDDKSSSDLHSLARNAIIDYRDVCPKVITLLAKLNPMTKDLSDYKGNTPVHYLLMDFSMGGRKPDLIRSLMTRKNINMQTNEGNTPLHHLLLFSYSSRPELKIKDIQVFKDAMHFGANINLKNKNGVSIKDIIFKRSDLCFLLNKG